MSEYTSSLAQGLIQGLTEYLPVSSSAHLMIWRQLTGSALTGLAFDLLLHLATVAATMVYFAKDIVELLWGFFSSFRLPVGEKKEGWYFGWSVILGSIPTAVMGLLLKSKVEAAGQSPVFVGVALLLTGIILLSLSFMYPGTRKICVSIGLAVGFAQGLAVFPGISRSGTTLAVGILCGLSADEAFRFSFLLSLPAIAGAALLELRHYDGVLPAGWLAALGVAFVSGLAALFVVRRLVTSGRWRYFALYCLAVGMGVLIFLR